MKIPTVQNSYTHNHPEKIAGQSNDDEALKKDEGRNMGRIRSLWLFLGLVLFTVSFYDVSADVIPSENECRPYIEKAIHELKNTATENESTEDNSNNTGEDTSIETTADDGKTTDDDDDDNIESIEKQEDNLEEGVDDNETSESQDEAVKQDNDDDSKEANEIDNQEAESENQNDSKEGDENSPSEENIDTQEETNDDETNVSLENDANENAESVETNQVENIDTQEDSNDDEPNASVENDENDSKETNSDDNNDDNKSQEADNDSDNDNENENDGESSEATAEENNNQNSIEAEAQSNDDNENNDNESQEVTKEDDNDTVEDTAETEGAEESVEEENVRVKRSLSEEAAPEENDSTPDNDETTQEENDSTPDDETSQENAEGENDDVKSEEQTTAEDDNTNDSQEKEDSTTAEESSQEEKPSENDDNEANESNETENEANESIETEKSEESMPEEDLTIEFEIPKNLRPRDHISTILGLDAKSSIRENALKRTGDVILKELKRIYDNAIKPLEQLYKYRDLSNRHFGDPEIFSKPLVLFMGPWSGGKSTILNYLTENEYTPNSIRSGAEPSPAYFNILMHGDEPEVLDGTQLAADWTFSGLQKFGQGLMDRLRGQKLPSKLLERVNIVEIPGILEVRKQVSRFFPFNDACQWFIDRADIIFLVYDPSKLDVGPETEAILDQLKGREYQTRILLNKGDQVKPEELLRVQSALIWNISPLMSSAQPPVMYTVSLWSHPFEQGAPVRLLQAQERALLADLREAIDKRIENKIASARRFAVRIRNHAKMVDCYLTTYYNQKSLFSNKKQVSDKIIEHPQNFNIYEGLSTLTNISRYDLPDPEVYLDFFRLNPLYEFKKLSETCTYFKGCPINKLDIAISYDLPELVSKYKKLMEENYSALLKEFDENCNQTEPEPPVKLR